MPVNQDIFDEIIDDALKIFRLIAHEQGQVLARLRELEKELKDKLAIEDVSNRQRRRVETFLTEIDSFINKRYEAIQQEIDFYGIGQFVAQETNFSLKTVLGDLALKVPTEDYFNSLNNDEIILYGHPAADWWRGQSNQLSFNFAGQVRQGLANAETNQQIINRIAGGGDHVGIMEGARKNAATLVQTSVQAVANDARRNTFQKNRDVIKGIRQVSTLDSHTSLICISYSDCEWDLDYKPIGPKDRQKPYNGGTPRHFNCRSVEVPITKTYKELGINIPEPQPVERASELGPISAKTTFEDFLKRRGKSYQDKMLGPGRADLWRSGKITLRDLVSAQGRPLSLAELKALAEKRR